MALKASVGHLVQWIMVEAVERAGRMRGITAGKAKSLTDCRSLKARYMSERQLQGPVCGWPREEAACELDPEAESLGGGSHNNGSIGSMA